MIKYSVIICTYNRFDYLVETLHSVLSRIENRSDVEVLVVDNNSGDETQTIQSIFSGQTEVKYFLELNQGLSHARNRGIKESLGDILIFLDDDIDLDHSYFERIQIEFENPSVNILGGKVLPFNSNMPEWLPSKYYYLASVFDLGDERLVVPMLMGANYAMRKNVADRVGYYNVELGRKGNNLMGGEESDYFNRASNFGYHLDYEPTLIVYHKIQPKLNKKYIFNYAVQCGLSEKNIDSRLHTVKYILKSFKCLLTIVLYATYGKITPIKSHFDFLRIEYLYALGYLKIKISEIKY